MAGCGHSRCEKWPACVERRKGQGRVEHSYQASWHCSKPYMSNVMDPHTSAFRQLLLTRSSTGKNIRPWKAKSLASPKYIIIYRPSSRNHSCSSYSGLVLTEATNYLTLKKNHSLSLIFPFATQDWLPLYLMFLIYIALCWTPASVIR